MPTGINSVPVLSSSPAGESGQSFVDRLTAGVGEEAFRQVFGFSLAELTDAAGLDAAGFEGARRRQHVPHVACRN